ncbi:hypothetical protein EDB92DRAFT_1944240 [Lactarius akahatsu]|uniref:F-box domain-containing protein n=1 Tax=Lactarius akahatsu TaxID=416441 RepID=A0AAD4Q994_9AGAM|nr:hypothetical protein EDB92DRAFT_1944240 [Lactarius akahatsu]
MDLCKANPREYQRQAIDAEIKSLKESIRVLRYRRNALAPVSSLPTEVTAAIFSFLYLPVWPMSVVNGATLHSIYPSSGITSISPSTAPLYLEARVPTYLWDGPRFIAFQKELQCHVSHICHLSISAEPFHLFRTLEGLISPAPTLEYLSLSIDKYRPRTPSRVSVPDTLFDGATPRLSCLKLRNCNISWKSPLLKGIENLEILMLSVNAKPSLAVWLDALDEMPQLKTLVLHSASPSGLFQFNIERTVTLPFLTHFDFSNSAEACALALAHLILPALTSLCLTAQSELPNGGDLQKLLPYVNRHSHGPQDTRPLQSVLIRGDRSRVDVFAWPVDIDVEVHNSFTSCAPKPSARVAFSVTSEDWFIPTTHIEVLDATMAALPLDNLLTLTAQHHTRICEQMWRRHAPRWPLLKRVRLAPPAARGFREMVLQDNGRGGFPLLPSLTKLDLIGTTLSAHRTLRLCDALMMRVEQGVPLEALDLTTCFATSRTVRLLGEIVVDVWGPADDFDTEESILFASDSAAGDPFVPDNDSGTEDYLDDDEDDFHTSDDDG